MGASTTPKIIYQDKVLIVLEKPAGIPSLSAKPGTQDPNTVEGWLKQKFPQAKLVHRLDNETSGLMVAARTEENFQILRALWKTNTVVKKYTALVMGRTPPSGKITTPIAHHPTKKKKMVVGGAKARPATTEFKTIRSFKNYSLLEIKIQTGVRHQIRVHLASIGHPIAGDKLYQKKAEQKEDWLALPRQFLHLSYLKFPHPRTQKEKEWFSDFRQFFDAPDKNHPLYFDNLVSKINSSFRS